MTNASRCSRDTNRSVDPRAAGDRTGTNLGGGADTTPHNAEMTENQKDRLQMGSETDASHNQVAERRDTLKTVVQDTRFTLIQNILGHPVQEPSLKELDFVNPSKSKSTIREHLNKLVDNGVVEKTELSKERRSRDLPRQFYRLTREGREFLETQGLLQAEETLRELYSRVEKPQHIKDYEEAPRPNGRGDSEEDTDSEDTVNLRRQSPAQ